ncbi:MAG: patatin-like phospholipase family protein [Pseudomonadota bacterium]
MKRKTGKIWNAPRAFLILLVAFVAACASRPEESQEIRTLIPQEAVDFSVGANPDVELPNAGKDNNHTVLALSAGGADGAFGAGVMAGWTASGTRPEFDVVTGVSTGSLLAVLAFLGPKYDELIRELYTTQTNDKIFRKRGIDGLFSDSLYDNGPLKEQIETHVTAALLAEVAEEHRQGRRLYIATTNLDAGELVIWDMGKIAQGGRTNPLQHFQKILRASSAVPGYFQPVYIKPRRGVQLRQAHVDGGVKEPVLYAPFMGRSNAKNKNLYMVINGTTRRYNASKPVEPKLASIAQKTISELIRELQRDTIFHHFVNATTEDVNFHLTSIPDSIPIAQDVLNFDQKRMQRLYKAGYEIGLKGPDTWRKRPANFNQQQMNAALELSQ